MDKSKRGEENEIDLECRPDEEQILREAVGCCPCSSRRPKFKKPLFLVQREWIKAPSSLSRQVAPVCTSAQ